MRLPPRSVLVLGLASIAGIMDAQVPPSRPPPPAVSGKKSIVNPPPPAISRAEEPVAPISENAPQPVGFESDIYCFGYLGNLSETFPVRVRGAESVYEQTDFITDDLLYADGGANKGLKVGDEFWIVTPEQEVF